MLAVAQILSGLGMGAVVSTGSLLAADISGSDAWAGSITTASTLGGAVASTVLARIAFSRGRRISLSSGLAIAASGSLLMIFAGTARLFPLLLLAGCMMGFGSAVNLQARFAATDLSSPGRQARDLSLIVWMSTIGAIAGPNMAGPGAWIARMWGIPELTGLFVFSALGMLLGMSVVIAALRPDPYLLSVSKRSEGDKQSHAPFLEGLRLLWTYKKARAALIALTSAQAVMVGVMAMTPVHLTSHGGSIRIVGVTVSLHLAGMYALSPLMGWLTDKIGPKYMISGGLIVSFIAAVMAGLSGNVTALTVVALALLGLGWSSATVAGSALLNDAVPKAIRVATQGASDSLMGLFGGSGGALAGLAIASIGYLGLGLVSAALISAAAGAVLFLLKRQA